MTSKNLADYGIYPRRSVVKQVVNAAKDESYRQAARSALLAERQGLKEFPTKKTTTLSEGIATGAGAGTVVGGALGWLMGIALFIGAIDPIMVALAGAASGCLLGGLAGASITMSILRHEANVYARRNKGGATVLPIQSDEKEWKNISHRFTQPNRG